jgi:hypothetical protein
LYAVFTVNILDNKIVIKHVRRKKLNCNLFEIDNELMKNVRLSVGSASPALMFVYLEKLFKDNPEGFFKFHAPCQHDDYKIGSSIAEETGWIVSTIQFRLNKICTLYKSRGLYIDALHTKGDEGIFQGFPYLRFIDHSVHKTYYKRNALAVDRIVKGIPLKGEPVSKIIPVGASVYQPLSYSFSV